MSVEESFPVALERVLRLFPSLTICPLYGIFLLKIGDFSTNDDSKEVVTTSALRVIEMVSMGE